MCNPFILSDIFELISTLRLDEEAAHCSVAKMAAEAEYYEEAMDWEWADTRYLEPLAETIRHMEYTLSEIYRVFSL